MELDRVPLWRGDHVAVKQLAEDFARYFYLPRLKDSNVLVGAVRDGTGLLDLGGGELRLRRRLRRGHRPLPGPSRRAARRPGRRRLARLYSSRAPSPAPQLDADAAKLDIVVGSGPQITGGDGSSTTGTGPGPGLIPGSGTAPPVTPKPEAARPKRFHGTVTLDATRLGRDAGRVAEEVIAHLTGIVGARVTVTLEVEAEIPAGASDHVVRTVTENSRTLKFTSQGFEAD